MGMLGHAIQVMIIKRKGEPLILEFWLDNEEYLDLTKNKGLFHGVAGTADLLKRIPCGFEHPFEEDEDIREYLRVFDYDGEYEAFEKKVSRIPFSSIESVVLMRTMNQEYGEHRYQYEWIKYILSDGTVSTGTGAGERACDAEVYLQSLISAAGEKVKESFFAEIPVKEMKVAEPFDPEAFARKMQGIGEQWMKKHGSCIEQGSQITFVGKTFVLSGMEALGDEYEISVEEEITTRGGVVRKSVSGKTDYLVVDPRWAGESKVKNAREQREKGKPIKIILGTDFIAAIQMPAPTENVEKSEPLAVVPQNDKASVQNEMKPEPTALSEFVIEGTCLEKYIGIQRDVVIPEGITEIGSFAFSDCDYLESVILPDSLRKIGKYAFSDCGLLRSVVLPYQIDSLGENAFNNCGRIYEISIPGTVKHIPEWLCSGCDGLVKVFIEEGVQTIADYAFNGEAAKDVFLPASVDHIEKYAFSYGAKFHVLKGSLAERFCIDNNEEYDNCLNDIPVFVVDDWLIVGDEGRSYFGAGGDVVVPAEVKSIHYRCFDEVNNTIRSVLVSEGVTIIQECDFSHMEQLERLVLPHSLSVIEGESVTNNPKLEEILLPSGVRTIEGFAFSSNPNLKKIYIPASVMEMGEDIFYEVNPDCTIYVEEGSCAEAYCKENGLHYEYGVLSEDQYQAAVTAFLQSAQTKQKVQKMLEVPKRKCEYRIKDETTVTGFSGNEVDFTIPEGILRIDECAFYGCNQMQSVKFPLSLRTIGRLAFSGNSKLKTAEMAEGLEEIGEIAFKECGLERLVFPSTLKEIGQLAFSDCPELESVSFGGELTTVGVYAFSSCSKLKTVEFFDEIQFIGEKMFSGCEMLTNICLPGKLREIRASAFSHCNGLTQIVIPVGVTKIAEEAFSFCENLKDIHITPFIREIGEDAFSCISEDAVFHVIKGTYAERYCQEHEFDYDYKLDPDLLKKVQAIVNARKQQMEKKRHEEEMRAEQERQRILSARRARYAEIEQAIALQMQIINQNKGWFGAQAQARKAAQEQLDNLQAQLAKEFPGGKP